jgi:hypothetical protein
VRAELPAGVPRGCFGPKLEAAIASLTVRNRLSRRQLVELLEELFGCPIAVGTIDAILSRTAETLEPVYEELLEQTRASGALNVDETGWYLSGEPRTLWGAFSKQTAVLRIAPDRGKQHLRGLIGDGFAGVVARIASAPTTASSRSGGRCAGRICAATSPSTPTSDSARKRPLGSMGSRSLGMSSRPGSGFSRTAIATRSSSASQR